MTHAFFKALLFMGAGSVIGAMAGIQDMDRMGGFRRAMPFTFVTFTVGALALAGFPLTAGFFSKDEIIAFAHQPRRLVRGAGDRSATSARSSTAFYAFRMVFRVFFGEPVPEARELEGGHMAHGEPMNPMTGEPEDTDVGFPGPEHHVAERAWPMKAAMGPLALLSIVGGVVAIPGISDILEKFLEPTFEDSRFHDTAPTTGAEVWGLVVGGVISILGIGLAWWVYVRQPGTAARVRERFAGLHRFLVNKWYFDELYDAMFVRPVATIGALQPARDRDGVRTGHDRGRRHRDRARGHVAGALDPDRLPARVRAAPAARRGGAHPLLPDHELMTIHLSIVLFLPLATGISGAFMPRDTARWAVLAGTVGVLAYVVAMLVDFDSRRRAPVDHERRVDLGARDQLQLGVDGLNLFLIALTAIAWVACTLVAAFSRVRAAAPLLLPPRRWPRPPCSARSWRRTWRSSSSSST